MLVTCLWLLIPKSEKGVLAFIDRTINDRVPALVSHWFIFQQYPIFQLVPPWFHTHKYNLRNTIKLFYSRKELENITYLQMRNSS